MLIVSFQWAFGILLWELFTRGKRPFYIVAQCDLLMHMETGGRPEKPSSCPDYMYVFHPERESFLHPFLSYCFQNLIF